MIRCSKCRYRDAQYGSSLCRYCEEEQKSDDVVDTLLGVAVGLAANSLLDNLFSSGSSSSDDSWSGGGGDSGGGGASGDW